MAYKYPRFYFSFRSPYSWVAHKLLTERVSPPLEKLEYIPYWEPDEATLSLLNQKGGRFLYMPMSRQKHLYILQDIKRIARALGFSITWPIDDKKPWWELPHLAYLKARSQGRASEFMQAVYRSRWERGENICHAETLIRIARDIDLDPQLVTVASLDAAIREEGAAALCQAEEDGVFGVPFFISGREKFWGIDRLNGFVKTFKHVNSSVPTFGIQEWYSEAHSQDSIPPTLADSEGSCDTDTAGGCG